MIPLFGELGELIEVLVIFAIKARRLLSNSCTVCYYVQLFLASSLENRRGESSICFNVEVCM